MGCYIVTDATIDAIAGGLHEWVGGKYANNFTATGQALLDMNYASVNARYGEREKAPVYRYTVRRLTLGHVLGAVKCWRYQSCEAPDFPGSDLDIATSELIGRLADLMARELGYPVPWGIEDDDLTQVA